MVRKISILCLLVLLVGCTKEKPLETNLENMKLVSDEMVLAIEQGDSKKIKKLSDFGDQKIDVLSLWESLVEDAGNFSTREVKLFETDDRIGSVIYTEFENKKLQMILRFNEKMKVEKLTIDEVSPLVEPVETDRFKEIALKVGVGEMLNGILTLPKGVENPPVAILLQGSGASNLNEEVYGNKPFEDIAHGLAKQGIASIRYDKRTYAYPKWDTIREATLDWEYKYDFSAVLHQLEKQPINHNQIYIIGHSQGGMLAPKLAYEHPEIKGIISLAGTPRGLEEVMKDQQINALLAQGMTLESLGGQIASIDANIEEIQSLTKETISDKVIWMLPLTYWYQMNQMRPKLVFNELKCDSLILQGEDDFQVFYDTDFEEWKKLAKGKSNVQLRSYPGLSHFFTPSINNTLEDYQVPASFDQSVLDDMASWIKTRKLEKEKKK